MNDINVFYDEIINEASTGRVDCFFMMNLLFSTYIREENKTIEAKKNDDGRYLIPRLVIKNKESFNKLLTEYLALARKKYDLSIYQDELTFADVENYEQVINKIILTTLWANATYDDFSESEEFLRKQIAFLKDETFSEYEEPTIIGYSETLGGYVEVENIQETILNETPNSLKISVIEPETNERYTFPLVRYGIEDNKCYIYAVQKNKKYDEENKFKKRVNRRLFQIGENFDTKNDTYENYGEGNLKDVSASFVVASNIALGLLASKGITDIVVPSILIERWNAKETGIVVKSKREENSQEYIDSNKEEHNKIQNNLTEKLLRTFLRIVSHNKTFGVTAYPFDIDSSLHIKTNEELDCNNTLLNETFLIGEKVNSKKI